jgi:ADP-heptose:LPS heptosyltransferase
VAIDKGRKEKKELTRKHNKILRPLKSTFSRYADVFALLGYPVDLVTEKGIKKRMVVKELQELKKQGKKFVGIAPFALHPEKTYPAEKMLEVLRLLSAHENVHIYLFG